MEMARLRAKIHGIVQGVNFRYYTRLKAQELGIKGWVRNNPDGTVEVDAEGEKEALSRLLEFLHRGPPSAVVTKVEAEWLPFQGLYDSFKVRF
jgi:acylphosphatase